MTRLSPLHPVQDTCAIEGTAVLFIDAQVSDVEHLLGGVLPGVAVQVLTPEADAIEQITAYLQRHPARTLHLISHGAPGQLMLGQGELNLDNLDTYADALATWFQTDRAELLLYGCHVAAGDAGAEFIEKLHRLTGATIAASTRTMGNGTWHLNAQMPIGATQPRFAPPSPLPVAPAVLATYAHLLATNLLKLSDFSLPTAGANPFNLTNINGTLYFSASDGTNGNELWKSDGTTAGTVLVKDILAGNGGASPSDFTNINGTLYFSANDGTNGREIWKSDGTAAGTVLVKDIIAGIGSSGPSNLTNVNGTLYFSAADGINGFELWKSDGTAAGTVLVKDIVAGNGDALPSNFTNVNGTLYFSAFDPTNGRELWKSDGTAAGTVLVKDLNVGIGSSMPSNLTNVNGTLYFRAFDPTNGTELWKSDGTAAGTVLVKDIFAGGGDALPFNLTNINGTLYFRANDGTNGFELWKSDGTAAGTVLVKDIVAGGGNSNPSNLTDINGTLYFSAFDPTNGNELWKSDGTAAGTVLVKDIVAGGGNSSPSNLTNVNGTFYFSAFDPTNGNELWKSDGTTAGTVLVKDIFAGGGFSSPFNLTNVNGTLYFRADDGTNGNELWRSDGTAAGTGLVKDLNVVNTARPNSLVMVGSVGYFVNYDPTNGLELWKSDGTAAGTVLVKDLNVGFGFSSPSNLTNVNGTLYFSAFDPTNGTELWKSDGTAAGTVLVKDIVAGGGSSNPFNLTNVNGTLYFTADDGINGTELWKSDGTAAGTVLVKDIVAGIGSSSPFNLTNVNGTLYFSAADPTNGFELWKSDGTAAGTVLVKDIVAGGGNSNPSFLTNINGTLYFSAFDPTNGNELWKSDGTTAGTVLVKDIFAGGDFSSPTNLTNVNGTLYFRANNGTNGRELWKSDGTAAGTVLVKDILAGPGSSGPSNLTNINGTLYFSAFDPTNGTELWKSDGTTAGTVLVKDIFAGGGFSSPSSFTNVNGTLYFIAADPTNGTELWKSDGTAAGTVLAKDFWVGTGSSSPDNLAVLGTNTLLLFADNGVSGVELYRIGSNEPPTGTVTISGPATQGQTLTASNTLADLDGLGTITYQWQADGTDITGAIGATLLLTQAQVGKAITVKASYTDGFGQAEAVTSAATAAVANLNDAPTGTVTITGTATQGQTLTASNDLADVDGLGTITYQWQADGTDITGAIGATLVLTQAQVAKAITVKASYTDGGGTVESVTSAASAAVANVNDSPTGTVTISGAPTQGQTLTASNTLADLDGLGTITYQWQADGTDITGATGTTLVLTQAQVAKAITVKASYTDGGNTPEAVTSAATAAVANVNDSPTGTVTISGTATQGKTLTASNTLADLDGLGPITYQWQAGGVDITGATGTTLVLTQAQVAKAITVKASYVDGFKQPEAVTSAATAVVANLNDAPTGTVTISGTATQSQTLTASNSLADVDGLGPITYQWQADGTDITGATGTTLVLTQAQVAKAITALARYTDGFGTPEAVVSLPTSVVTAIAPPVTTPPITTPPVTPPPVTPPPVTPPPVTTPLVTPPPVTPPPVTAPPPPPQITPLPNQLLAVTGNSPTRLSVTVSGQGASSVLDLVVVVVDDGEGRINGLLPGASGYTAAAVARASNLLSVLKSGDFAGQFGRRSLPIAPGQFLQFALSQGGTLDDLKRGGAGQLFFATAAANGNGQSIVQYRALAQGYAATFSLPGATAPTITLQLSLDATATTVGSQQQGTLSQSELLDLTGMAGSTATLTMSVFREAFYNNIVGLYTVQNAQGQVRDPLTGGLINPGEAGYLQAALANRVVSNLAGQNGQTLTYTANVATGQLLSTFLVVNGTLDALLDSNPTNDPTVFFNYMAANGDGQDHVRLLGDNVFGYEDIVGGGDRGFNDVIVKVAVA